MKTFWDERGRGICSRFQKKFFCSFKAFETGFLSTVDFINLYMLVLIRMRFYCNRRRLLMSWSKTFRQLRPAAGVARLRLILTGFLALRKNYRRFLFVLSFLWRQNDVVSVWFIVTRDHTPTEMDIGWLDAWMDCIVSQFFSLSVGRIHYPKQAKQ